MRGVLVSFFVLAGACGNAPPPKAETTTAPTSSTTSREPERGTCKDDADCVLTSYQEGCCNQGCVPYAMPKRDLAAAQEKEDCTHKGPKTCPPPAPCARTATRATAAVCRASKCTALTQPVQPGKVDPD